MKLAKISVILIAIVAQSAMAAGKPRKHDNSGTTGNSETTDNSGTTGNSETTDNSGTIDTGKNRGEPIQYRYLDAIPKRNLFKIASDDPRTAEFPGFAELGDMWWFKDLSYVLSEVAPKELNYTEARIFCESLDSPSKGIAGGAEVPSMKQWHEIWQLTNKGEQALCPLLIPELGFSNTGHLTYWSRDINTYNLGARVFRIWHNYREQTEHRENHFAVRCIRPVDWK